MNNDIHVSKPKFLVLLLNTVYMPKGLLRESLGLLGHLSPFFSPTIFKNKEAAF